MRSEQRDMVFICHELITPPTEVVLFTHSVILKLKFISLEITLKSKWIKGPDVAGRMTNQTGPG